VSQTPERIEREMFEIRSRMSMDVTDLRKHVEPQFVAEKVKRTVRQRIGETQDVVEELARLSVEVLALPSLHLAGDVLKDTVARVRASLRASLRATRQEFVDSARRQVSLAREAGEKRDPTPFTDAVRSDPRPLALLAILLAITLFTARKTTGNRGDRD